MIKLLNLNAYSGNIQTLLPIFYGRPKIHCNHKETPVRRNIPNNDDEPRSGCPGHPPHYRRNKGQCTCATIFGSPAEISEILFK
jgi:hypothetical protein